jgi:hypothetical protein
MSRPLLSPDKLKTTASTYLSPAEREQVQARADAAHLPLAAFLRRAALGQRVHAVPTGNAARWAELARTTAALSNLAKHANAEAKKQREQNGGGVVLIDVPPDLLADLRAEVEALRRELLGMEGAS